MATLRVSDRVLLQYLSPCENEALNFHRIRYYKDTKTARLTCKPDNDTHGTLPHCFGDGYLPLGTERAVLRNRECLWVLT